MSLQLTSPPAVEPVSLDEAKAWLQVESGNDEDALIGALIPAARARAEWHTGCAFITQGWTLWLDRIGCAPIGLPLPPLVSVNSVTLYAPDGAASVLPADQYQADAAGGRLWLKQAHPGLRAINAAAVAFTAGYGDSADAVPAPIRSAILHLVGALYEHRGGDAAPSPDAALALLAPYRALKL